MTEPIFDGWTPPSNWKHPRQADIERAEKVLRQQCNLHSCPQDQEIFGKDCHCPITLGEIYKALEDADAEFTKRINDPRSG